jgi:hypothetical protein
VFGVAWHHDGAAKGPKPIGFGNCWVVAGIVVQLPFLSRPVCLPVLARLWRPRHAGKIAHARQLAELIATRYPDRTVHVVGDAAYVGERARVAIRAVDTAANAAPRAVHVGANPATTSESASRAADSAATATPVPTPAPLKICVTTRLVPPANGPRRRSAGGWGQPGPYRVVAGVPNPGTVMTPRVIATMTLKTSATVSTASISARVTGR